MRVLLREDAAEASADTILVMALRGYPDPWWHGLMGPANTERAVVAEAADAVVVKAISRAVGEADFPGTPRQMFKDVERMARILARCPIGSKIQIHLTPSGHTSLVHRLWPEHERAPVPDTSRSR
jgi:hypothetical protein